MNNEMPELGFNLGSFERQSSFDRPVTPQDGTSYWRILPPHGTNHNRQLFHRYSLHWGMTNAAGKKTPVQCSYPFERFCPIDQRVNETKKLAERAKEAGDKAKYEELMLFVGDWGARTQFVYNAVNSSGEVVMLGVGKTAHDGLADRIMNAVTEWKFDPTSLVDGVWFAITRTGKGFQTEYKVDFKKTKVTLPNGQIAEMNDRGPLDERLANEIRAQLAQGVAGPLKDIHNLHEVRTASELKAMMDGSMPVGRSTSQQNPNPAQPQVQTSFAPPVYQAPPVMGGAPVPPASTGIPPTMAAPTAPGTGIPQQPTNTTSNVTYDAAEARKRLEERLRSSSGQQS